MAPRWCVTNTFLKEEMWSCTRDEGGERTMTMPTWPVRFDGVPTAVKSAPLLGEHTAQVLADWLGLDVAAVAGLRHDGIV
jgi:crotonobetainyl-CoA:carnitine CoA-transferase CaiB-like acyl-CoA transferase